MEKGKSIIEPAGDTGIDPETAANDIRRFWMQVEKAQEFSSNEEPCSNGRREREEDTAKASG